MNISAETLCGAVQYALISSVADKDSVFELKNSNSKGDQESASSAGSLSNNLVRPAVVVHFLAPTWGVTGILISRRF